MDSSTTPSTQLSYTLVAPPPPPPRFWHYFLFYTTSLFPKLLLYSFDMCKLSVQNGGKKKNHYYYKQQREIDDDNVFWAKFKVYLSFFMRHE